MAARHPIEPFPPEVDGEAFGHWLSGLTDGEGCFELRFVKKGTHAFDQPVASFAIYLRDDDLAILQRIRSYWQCGGIRPVPRPGGNPGALFRIWSTMALAGVVAPHFERYPLRAKKARDFVTWKRGVDLLALVHARPRRRLHPTGRGGGLLPKWTPAERQEFGDLVAALRAQRRYVPGGAVALAEAEAINSARP